ncbi:uncharacterized protein LOC126664423 isoform X2 [Mercurialis annua]|uniref:uncharacterized protein LOC126664423 isoform X2 n=1 Tax=Mercurialis annua TaxID=3986 RepID=UPI0021605947|nr:uncharacterized protein LOC126664423 isoform X2 [Mercurialis annua]
MDIDLDNKKQHSIKVEVDTNYGNIVVKSDGIGSGCVDNDEKVFNVRSTLLNEKSKQKDPEDVEVDIIASKNINDIKSAEAEDPDATEYSSSFADTLSDTEKFSGLSENEVESQFFGDSDLASPYDAFNSTFQTRKKKLTNHWRSFIRPMSWRCKWTELKIKEVESRALKYARELAVYEERKQIYQTPYDGFCSKLSPFSNQCYRRWARKRRKRKRIEEKTDTTVYVSQHSLFSYIESKRSNPDGSSMIDDFDNAATERHADCNDNFGDQLSFEFRGGDKSSEQVLRKIEIVQTRIQKLKNQLDLVISKNADKFSSYENLSLLSPCDGQTSSAPSPTLSAGNGETISVGAMHNETQHISEYDFGDLVLPDSEILGYGEAIHVPDIIESTVGMLSAADVTSHQPQIGDSCEYIVDNVLVHTETADGERGTFVATSAQLLEEHQEPEIGHEAETLNPCPISSSGSDPITKSTVTPEESILKSCLASDFQFPRNKRKRVERKAGSGGWNKKGSGDPDSQ